MEPLNHWAYGGGQVAKLSLEQEGMLTNLIEENNDAILVELCDQLEQSVGVRISRATFAPRHYWLVHPLLLLCFTQRRTAVGYC